jgi:5-hydroxyisourate hydrolase-like protein (transthyretin family)
VVKLRLLIGALVALAASWPTTGAVAADNGAISGVVVDARQHLPIAGLCVTASPADGGRTAGTARTDQSGSFTVAGLATGDYWVSFGSCPSPWARQMYSGSYAELPSDWTKVHVNDGQTTPAINAVMERYATISGQLRWASTGAPIEHACVEVFPTSPHDGSEQPDTETDSAGRYQVSVSPGDWILVFGCVPGADVAPTAYSATGSRYHATSVHVSDGQTVTAIGASLPHAAHLIGHVHDRAGHPLAGVQVVVWPDYRGRVEAAHANSGAETNSRGRYVVKHLPAGSFTVWFYDLAGHKNYYRNAKTAADARTIWLKLAQTRKLRAQTFPRS